MQVLPMYWHKWYHRINKINEAKRMIHLPVGSDLPCSLSPFLSLSLSLSLSLFLKILALKVKKTS
jgi:hypothetical protein